jgi:serine/threonine protein kinase
MLAGYLPFEDPETDKLYKKILSCDYSIPNYVSESGSDLIRRILNTDPEARYNITQIR